MLFSAARRLMSGFLTTIVSTIIVISVVVVNRGVTQVRHPANALNKAGIVSHVKVVSDKVEDVSSLEAWKQSFIREGMSDDQKALAIWKTVVKFQCQDSPPSEYLQLEDNVLDPIKMFNVYGYSYCSVAAANVQALARYAGLQARGWTINAHVVPEVFWDGEWHLLDASLINFFPKAGGKLAAVEEIIAGVKEWYRQHPDLKDNDQKLRAFMTNSGWRQGPPILSRSRFYDENGWLPAGTHGWYSTMQEYGGATLFPYESGYSQGYEVNVQLRRGERLTRNWSNQKLHINMHDKGDPPGSLNERTGEGMLRHAPGYGVLAPGRIGNGTLEYDVPLTNVDFRSGVLTADNLACSAEDGLAPAMHVKNSSIPGVLIIRMPSSYVYLRGAITCKTSIGNRGKLSIFVSDNNGLDWKSVAIVTSSGDQKIDLTPLVFRRYDYRLKFVLEGKGSGLDTLRIANTIQHSQVPLPALATGANVISFSSDNEGTITIEGSTSPESKGKQLLYTDFRPETIGISSDRLVLTGDTGTVTFPVETPGEMTRLRIGAFYRARDKADGWTVQVSFDRGQSFDTVARLDGPTVAFGRYVVTDVPKGVKSARVRFSGTQRNTTMLYNMRVDADYKEPYGAFLPVKITYRWLEEGQSKQHVHIARTPTETYSINCSSSPIMQSIILETATK